MSKDKKVTLTGAQLEAKLKKARDEGFGAAELLLITAMIDEFKFGEDEIIKLIHRVNRYDDYVDEGLIRMKQTKEILENNTGMKFF